MAYSVKIERKEGSLRKTNFRLEGRRNKLDTNLQATDFSALKNATWYPRRHAYSSQRLPIRIGLRGQTDRLRFDDQSDLDLTGDATSLVMLGMIGTLVNDCLRRPT